jgi:hypothetical protein
MHVAFDSENRYERTNGALMAASKVLAGREAEVVEKVDLYAAT